MSLRLGSIRYTPEGYRKIPVRIHRQVPEIEEGIEPRCRKTQSFFRAMVMRVAGWMAPQL